MAAILVLVYVAIGAVFIRGLIRGYRVNHRILAGRPGASYGGGNRAPEGQIQYLEDGAVPVGRLVGVLGGAFVGLAAVGLISFGAAIDGLGWIAVALSGTALLMLALTLLGSKPGLRLYENGVALGFVTYAEKRPEGGTSARFGVPRHAVFLPYLDITEVRFIDGVASIVAEQRDMARSAPTRVAGSAAVPMKVLGDFYSRGLPSAVCIRIRPDRLPEVPSQAVYSGPGRRQPAQAVYWSGPEFLIGTRDPEGLRTAVRARLDPSVPVM